MRKLLLVLTLFCTLAIQNLSAQLDDGSIAPNWTLTDLNGNSHTLYDILNSGKPVVLDFSATWCGPCWNYHNSGVLEELYDDYGPSGTNEIRVFYIEADLSTNEACLYGPSGCVGGTQGNWVAGTGYPIINLTSTNGPNVAGDYEINYFPTLYAVAPNKKIYEVGQASVSGWENWLFGSFKLAVSGTAFDAECPQSGGVDLQVTAGAPPLSYDWSNGDHTPDLSGVDAGDYDVTVTDGNGFEAYASFTVDGPAVPLNLDNSSVSNVVCYGQNNGSVSVDPNGGYPGYDIQWSNGESGNMIEDLEPGLYSVVVTDNNGCTITESYVVEEPALLTASTTTFNATCNNNNGSAYITANGGEGNYSYQISNGNPFQSNPFFQNLYAGNYTYTVKDANLCTKTGSFTVISSGSPDGNSSSSGNLTCAVPEVSVSGVPGNNNTYLWTTTNGNIVSGANTITAIVNAPGTYNLKVTDNTSGCFSTSDVVVNQDVLAPSLTVTNGLLTCSTTAVDICATSNMPVTWTLNGNPVQQNCINVNAAGNYVATALNAANGCIANAVSVVTLSNDLPQIGANAPAPITCTVPQVTIEGTLNGNVADFTISWATANGVIVSGGNTLTPVVSKGGDYAMTAVNNATQCQASYTVNVPENINTPVSQFSSAVASGNLTLTNTSNVQNGSATWDLGGGNTATGESVTVTFPATGVYTICLSVSNECGSNTHCSDVQYYTALAVGGTIKHLLCNGSATGEVATSVTGGPITGQLAYAWTGPNGFTSTEANIANLPAGDYTCIITDEIGLSATNTFSVLQPTAIDAQANVVNASNGQANGSIELTIVGGTGDYSITWSNGATGASINNLAAGTYTANILDANACLRTIDVIVSNSVSTNDPAYLSTFAIYPNPAVNFINLNIISSENLDDAKLVMYNHAGTKVLSRVFNGKTHTDKIDVTNLPAGLYLVELQTKKGNAIRKVIITE